MSLFGADFFRHSERLLYVDGAEMANLKYRPHGYLMLGTEEDAEAMEQHHQLQT